MVGIIINFRGVDGYDGSRNQSHFEKEKSGKKWDWDMREI